MKVKNAAEYRARQLRRTAQRQPKVSKPAPIQMADGIKPNHSSRAISLRELTNNITRYVFGMRGKQ